MITDIFTPAPYEIAYYDGGRHFFRGDPVTRDACLLRASGHSQPGCPVEIAIHRHLILSYTPSGAWIETYENKSGKKFVNLRAGKQWASTTEEEAIDQLYWRKCCQVRILESRLDEAQAAKEVLEKHFGKKPRAPRQYRGEYDYFLGRNENYHSATTARRSPRHTRVRALVPIIPLFFRLEMGCHRTWPKLNPARSAPAPAARCGCAC